jgi:hypothetical protein
VCLTCGCHQPLVDHGDGRNITHQELVAAADAAGITPGRAVANLVATESAMHGTLDAAALFTAAASRPTVVSDLDGVLAFTTEAALTAVNARFGLNLLVDEQVTYSLAQRLNREQGMWLTGLFSRSTFLANLAPDGHALDALDAMHAAGIEVLLCTERPPSTKTATAAWLSTWDVSHDDLLMPGPGGKPAALAAYGPANPAVLIDDDPSKWLTVARPGLPVWTPRRPWTPTTSAAYANVWVFDSWDQVLSRLLSTDPQEVSGPRH